MPKNDLSKESDGGFDIVDNEEMLEETFDIVDPGTLQPPELKKDFDRLQKLAELIKVAQKPSSKTEGGFRTVLNKALALLDITEESAKQVFAAKLETVEAWANGLSTPNSVNRAMIIRWVVNKAQEEMDKLDVEG